MQTFHVLFIPKGENISTGKNYTAESVYDAMAEFYSEFPDAEFLQVSSQKMNNYKY
jgi:hypothetical protein